MGRRQSADRVATHHDMNQRSAMEFGVAADAYRSDPSRQATRAGALLVPAALAAVVCALCLFLEYAATKDITLVSVGVGVFFGLSVLLGVHVSLEWERVVVMRFGRLSRVAGPGLFFTIPLVEFCTIRIDQRVIITPFGAEATLTSDLVPIDIDAVLSWMIFDPEKACSEVEDVYFAVALSAQTALRDAIGRAAASEVVTRRNQLDKELRHAIEEKVGVWGVNVLSVDVRDMLLPPEMVDAMSAEAQAERRKAARITLTEAEGDISEMLREISKVYEESDKAFELRKLYLVSEGMWGSENTLVVPSSYSEGFVSPRTSKPDVSDA